MQAQISAPSGLARALASCVVAITPEIQPNVNFPDAAGHQGDLLGRVCRYTDTIFRKTRASRASTTLKSRRACLHHSAFDREALGNRSAAVQRALNWKDTVVLRRAAVILIIIIAAPWNGGFDFSKAVRSNLGLFQVQPSRSGVLEPPREPRNRGFTVGRMDFCGALRPVFRTV